jgi:hypothetical protein
MSGIHHEDPKNTKVTGAAPSRSVLDRVDGTSARLSAWTFVVFVHFVVSSGEDLESRLRLDGADEWAKLRVH